MDESDEIQGDIGVYEDTVMIDAAPEPPAEPQPELKQKPFDIGLKQPCFCGSEKKLKACCYDKRIHGVGHIIVDVLGDGSTSPAYCYVKEGDVERLELPVFDTYKAAAESLAARAQNVIDSAKLKVAAWEIEAIEIHTARVDKEYNLRRKEADLGEIDFIIHYPTGIGAEETGATV